MGNTSSTSKVTTDEIEHISSSYALFTKLSVETVSHFVTISKQKSGEVLLWREFFKTFELLHDEVANQTEILHRNTWHPSTHGYAMKKKRPEGEDAFEEEGSDHSHLDSGQQDDYHTDDDRSSISSNDNSDEERSLEEHKTSKNNTNSSRKPSSNREKAINHTNPHPVFANYHLITASDEHQRKTSEKEMSRQKTIRAIETALKVRQTAVDQMQTRYEIQKKQREKKIIDITEKYDNEVSQLRGKFERQIGSVDLAMQPVVEEEFERKLAIQESAYEEEFSDLQAKHLTKLEAETAALTLRHAELRALKQIQEPQAPLASELERFAKIELGRLSQLLKESSHEVEKLKNEFYEMKSDFLEQQDLAADQQGGGGGGDKKKNNAQAAKTQELRSMLNVAETRLKESIKAARVLQDELLDAEALMLTAINLASLEEALHPFFHRFETLQSNNEVLIANRHALTLGLIILCKGSFLAKLDLLLTLYAQAKTRYRSFDEITVILQDVLSSLQSLKLITGPTLQTEQIDSLFIGRFKESYADSRTDSISEYDFQKVLLQLLIRNREVARWFGLQESHSLSKQFLPTSAFNTSLVKEVGYLKHGLTSSIAVVYAQFHSAQIHRPQLSALSKRRIHDIALGQGNNDPYKVDFGRFLTKQGKNQSYYVDPLRNGRYTSTAYYLHTLQTDSAIKIQALVRGIRDRKQYQLESMLQAYETARNKALILVKTRILKEFQHREAGKGLGKMKWDGEVRIQQAKLRAGGKQVSRSDTIMLMVEDAVLAAQSIVNERFHEILPNELVKREKDREQGEMMKKRKVKAHEQMTMEDMYGVRVRPVQIGLGHHHTTAAAAANKQTGKGSKSGGNQEEDAANEGENEEEEEEEVHESDEHAQQLLDQITQSQHVDTLTIQSFLHKYMKLHTLDTVLALEESEDFITEQLRIAFASSCYSHLTHLEHTLTLLHPAMTAFKAKELLKEFPSKRLLARYFMHTPLPQLAKDLITHFKFKPVVSKAQVQLSKQQSKQALNTAEEVARALREFILMDNEIGLLGRLTHQAIVHTDTAYHSLIHTALLQDVTLYHDTLPHRAAAAAVHEYTIVHKDYTAALDRLQRSEQASQEIAKTQVSINHSLLVQDSEIWHYQRRLAVLQQHAQAPVDDINALNTQPLAIYRYDWWRRWKDLQRNNLHFDTYNTELEAFVSDFYRVSEQTAQTVIDELYHLPSDRTIPPVLYKPIDGRGGKISGRGYTLHDQRPVYRAHGLYLTICADYDGVFDGSDELASKAASKERLAAQLIFEAKVQKVLSPLVLTVDYHGYRVLVTTTIPIDIRQYSDDGLLQSSKQELVHGMNRSGEFFTSQSRVAHSFIKLLALKLNLAEHTCRGSRDLSGTMTYASGLKVYRGEDGGYYLRHVNSLLPRELPMLTPHLMPTPRHNSIFWRYLRPEYTKTLTEGLSTDVGMISSYHAKDEDVFHQLTTTAVEQLLSKKLRDFAMKLLTGHGNLLQSMDHGFSLSHELHRHGVNIRHLGLLRSCLWRPLPGLYSIYHGEKKVKTGADILLEVTVGSTIIFTEGSLSLTVETVREGKNKEYQVFVTQANTSASIVNKTAIIGTIHEARDRPDLSSVLLVEIVARCLKQIIRGHWRSYSERTRSTSSAFQRSSVCEFWNLITCARDGGNVFFGEVLFNKIRENFGPHAVYPSERKSLQGKIGELSRYVIGRLCSFLGLHIRPTVFAAFAKDPRGFVFHPGDLTIQSLITKSSIPIYKLAVASNLSTQAERLQTANRYRTLVAETDKALLALFCSEMPGSQFAYNSGSLGKEFCGKISEGCVLTTFVTSHDQHHEHIDDNASGPIQGDKAIKAYVFSPSAGSTIDLPFDKRLIPVNISQAWTIEVSFRLTGGKDTLRTMIDSGRFQVSINRENRLSLTVFEGHHAVTAVITPLTEVNDSRWHIITATFDGIKIRAYLDSELRVEMDFLTAIHHKELLFEREYEKRLVKLKTEEEHETQHLHGKSASEAVAFFQTKEGQSAVKDSIRKLLELEEENDAYADAPADETQRMEQLKQRKLNALKIARETFTKQIFDKNVRELIERYKQLSLEIEDHKRRVIDQGKLHSYTSLRIGGMQPDANNRLGSCYFYGHLSCIAVYDYALTTDRIMQHCRSARRNSDHDAFAIYSQSVSVFAAALREFTGDLDNHMEYLTRYSNTICRLFSSESSGISHGSAAADDNRTAAKAELRNLIDIFQSHFLASALSQIIRNLPRDEDLADIIVQSLLVIKEVDKNYLYVHGIAAESQFISLPLDLGLVSNPKNKDYLLAAAFVFQQVTRDRKLAFAYGEVNLHWLMDLRSAAMIVSIVAATTEDKQLKVIRVKEEYHKQITWDSPILDDLDVQVLADHLPLAEGIDLSHCNALGNAALENIARFGNLRMLILDHCSQLADTSVALLGAAGKKLEVASFDSLARLEDHGLTSALSKSTHLKVLNLSGCMLVSPDVIADIVARNQYLTTLSVARLPQLTDGGLVAIAEAVRSCQSLTSLDFSFCTSITENGLLAINQAVVGKLKLLNLQSCARISSRAIQSFTNRCWALENLNLEDVYLMRDSAFVFDNAVDGRAAAQQEMMKQLKSLNITACHDLTDRALGEIAEHCRQLTSLTLKNCGAFTDKGLAKLRDPKACPYSLKPLCVTLKALDLSYAGQRISRGELMLLLKSCVALNALDVSGLALIVDDELVREISKDCPAVQQLAMNKCVQITDASMCYLAEALWLERIELAGCHRITDSGVEVLAEASLGMIYVDLTALRLITSRSIRFLRSSCKNLKTVLCSECPLLTEEVKKTVVAGLQKR